MSTRNIIIAGESGVGKSSLVNLILGEARAFTSNDAGVVTLDITRHPATILGHYYYLWDTPGLNARTHGNLTSKHTREMLQNLLTRLEKTHGAHLLILCFRGSRITKAMRETYMVIKGICAKVSSRVPVVAVITGLEKMAPTQDGMENWWTDNQSTLTNFGMKFAGHVCITTLPAENHLPTPGLYRDCQMAVHDLIRRCSLPPRSTSPQDINVVLFGETGVGKSSLINLIMGQRVAATSTMDSKEHTFDIGFTKVQMWETVGLNEPESDTTGYLDAVEKIIQLVKSLNAAGGISLFLFCIREDRITATTQSNYRLFYEILGRKEVPVALVITHLECEQHMEDWWPRNEKLLEHYGIASAGHACVTGVIDHPKYLQSRDAICALLMQYDERGKFTMPPEGWIAWSIRWLTALVTFLMGRDILWALTERCHLDIEVAQRVATCLE